MIGLYWLAYYAVAALGWVDYLAQLRPIRQLLQQTPLDRFYL